jgi:hypothetical protein
MIARPVRTNRTRRAQIADNVFILGKTFHM